MINLEEKFIVSNSLSEIDTTEKDKIMYVYFLVLENKIVYVGKTKSIETRIRQHENCYRMKFDRFFYIKVEASKAGKIEADYIVKFNPVRNKEIPTSEYKTVASRIKHYVDNNIDDFVKKMTDSNIDIIDFRGKKYVKKNEFIDNLFNI